MKIKEITCQKFDEDFIENIVEDPIEVKHGNESIIHNPRVLVDLLRMTTQYVDFLGVENFNFIINPLLIDVANKLKVDKKKFYATPYEEFKFQNQIKLLKHSKYLFIWSRRFQISTINSRTSLFQVEGSDVGHNLLFNYCNLLLLVFLYKKKNVILGLGDLFPCFYVHLMLFRSNLVSIMVRYQLGVILNYIFLSVKF